MQSNKKINLFKQLKTDYRQTKKPLLLETTAGHYLAINGKGAPGSDSFQQAIQAIYSMAFTIKMTRKANGLGDYVVCKLEALWWADGHDAISQLDQDVWQWKLMIRTPDCVGDDDLEKACAALLSKEKTHDVGKAALENLDEGLCVQMLHVGPYDKEDETIELMRSFMTANNVKAHDHHHEIYISDPRRVDPEKLKTILRQPVMRV